MSCFDPDNGFFIHERVVNAHMWVTEPGSFRIATVFITKLAGQHKYFFATEVPMRLESLIVWPFYECDVFGAVTMQRYHLESALTG